MSRSSTHQGRRTVRREVHILASGMFTVPADCIEATVTAIGGGGGGLAVNIGGTPGGVVKRSLRLTPGAVIPVSIGAGSASVTAGNTTFGSLLTAPGALTGVRREGAGLPAYGNFGSNTNGYTPVQQATSGLDGWATGGAFTGTNNDGETNTGDGGAVRAMNTNPATTGASGRIVVAWEVSA